MNVKKKCDSTSHYFPLYREKQKQRSSESTNVLVDLTEMQNINQ